MPKVRREICSKPVSLGSFSEAQHIVDPAILEQVFQSLSQEVRARHGASMEGKSKAVREWMSHDGSVFPALPRMAWALYGAGRNGDANGVKLHLSLTRWCRHPGESSSVCEVRICERAELRKRLGKVGAYVAERDFGIDYGLFDDLRAMGCSHWMAESRNGATIQIHLALIASLLLQLQMGKRPSKRIWVLMRWHSMGMASSEDVAKRLTEVASAQARAEEKRAARENFFRRA